jgi:hypothetical protein
MGILIRWIKLPILSLLIAMILGRLAFAFGLFILGQFLSLPYGPEAFIKVSLINAPGNNPPACFDPSFDGSG